MIKANFMLRRNLGYYVLQMYVPCCLIVFCSFVSFWINPDDVPGRVTLAAMTVLSITTLGFIGRAALPKVNYATALDWFVILCFGTVFAVLIEYAVINFIEKVRVDIQRLLEERKKQKKLLEELKAEVETEEEEEDDMVDAVGPVRSLTVPKILMTCEVEDMEDTSCSEHDEESDVDIDSLKVAHLAVPAAEAKLKVTRSFSVPTITKGEYRFNQPRLAPDTSIDIMLEPRGESTAPRITLRSTLLLPVSLWRKLRILPTEEDVAATTEVPDKFSSIDIYSRLLFPLVYVTLLAGYYTVYTYYVVDDKARFSVDKYN